MSWARLALPVLLITACAGTTPDPARSTAPGGALHDPAREWEGRRPGRSLPPPKPAPRVLSEMVPVEREPIEIELQDFGDAELERIQAVQPIVRAASLEHGIPRNVINGIIWVESKFRPDARGKKGPRGLMQLMPRTARAVARELARTYAPHDPDFNIHAGTYYYARMLEMFDHDPRVALAAYNIGPGVVRRWLESDEPFVDSTRRYVDLVFAAAEAFHARGY